MKIAVCFSGQIREGVLASPNIINFLGNLLPSIDFFIHSWDKNTSRCLEISCKYFMNDEDCFDIRDFVNIYKPKIFKIESKDKVHHELTLNGYKTNEYLPDFGWTHRFYSWQKSIEYKCQYENDNNFVYDYVIKLRPDCIFSPNIKLEQYLPLITFDTFAVNQFIDPNGLNIALDDKFFISRSVVANKVSTWNDASVKKWVSPRRTIPYIDPHSIFYDYVIDNNFKPLDLNLKDNIAIYRPECTIFNPIDDYNKCSELDNILFSSIKKISNVKELKYLTLTELNIVKNDIKLKHGHDIIFNF